MTSAEVRRCACLLPAFGLAAEAEGGRPLAVVEVGASAGLNLLWDRYGYDYGGRVYGVAGSPVWITCEVQGERRPPIPEPLPQVGWRLGIDLNPIDVRDDAATRWLRALVWPDQPERADLLARAIELARTDPPRMLAGDALDLLPAALAEIPSELTLCVVHTHTLNQFSPEARARFDAILRGASHERPLYRISGEGVAGADFPELRFTAYRSGEADERRLARYEGHGEWIEWRS